MQAPLAFLAVWEVACRVLSIRPVLLPGPIAVFGEIMASPAWFAEQTAYTLGITLAGFAAAVVFGVLFAIVIVEWKLLERLLFPLFVALNSVPKVALAPLFIIWFGVGDDAQDCDRLPDRGVRGGDRYRAGVAFGPA